VEATTRSRTSNNFDALRLFAALTVVVHHSVFYLDERFLWVTKENGWWFSGGVPLFFILSGFLVYRSAEKAAELRRPWWDFYWNRFLRIAPAFYLAGAGLIGVLGVLGYLSSASPTAVGAFFGTYLIFAPLWNPAFLGNFGGGVGNSSLWTIPVEVSFYVIVPALVWLARRTSWRTMMIAAGAVAVISLLSYSIAGGNAAPWPGMKLFGFTALPFLVYFLLGMLVDRIWDRLPSSPWIALACLVAYFVVTIPGLRGPASTDLLVNALSAVPLAYAAMWVGRDMRPFHPQLFGRFDLSFGAYLWHQVVINVAIVTGILAGVSGEAAVAVVLLATLLMALVSRSTVEVNALKLKRYSLRGSGVEPPVATPASREIRAH